MSNRIIIIIIINSITIIISTITVYIHVCILSERERTSAQKAYKTVIIVSRQFNNGIHTEIISCYENMSAFELSQEHATFSIHTIVINYRIISEGGGGGAQYYQYYQKTSTISFTDVITKHYNRFDKE